MGMAIKQGFLPTADALCQLRVIESATCFRCGDDQESITHALCYCPRSVEVWDEIIQIDSTLQQPQYNFLQFLFDLIEAKSWNLLLLTIVAGWTLWNERNRDWAGEIPKPPSITARTMFTFMEDFHAAETTGSASMVPQQHRQASLLEVSEGWTRINVDASWSDAQDAAGYGWIARDSAGNFLEARAGVGFHIPSPFVAEIWATKKAVQSAVERGFSHVILEGDAAKVINQLKSPLPNQGLYGALIEDIKDLFPLLANITIRHVNRLANTAADALAKYGKLLEEEKIWVDVCPNFLQQFVNVEVNL